MSPRDAYPKAGHPSSHFFVTLARGGRLRSLAIRPCWLYAALSIAPLLCTWYLGATLYLIFRDDMLAALMRRQAEMQYAYEDRLAAMRKQIDRITSHQLLDQDSLEGKVHSLISRQVQLENRAALISVLADRAGVARDTTSSAGRLAGQRPKSNVAATVARSVNPLLASVPVGVGPAATLPDDVSGFASVELRRDTPLPGGVPKPRPEEVELRPTGDSATAGEAGPPIPPTNDHGLRTSDAGPLSSSLAQPDLSVGARLSLVDDSLARIGVNQTRALDLIEASAKTTVSQLSSALAAAGLSADRMAIKASAEASATGGPFVPLKVDPNGSPFEQELSRLQSALIAAERLTRVISSTPLRRPIGLAADVTSGFGGRTDPFNGRIAMHTGVDFRDEYGAPVRATAPGRVLSAGHSGGYGNMVEIDHGNGLTTRYAHLSAIAVADSQWVEAGAVLGQLGSTGRSTGPHLHYEVRIDGEPVDPMRFLKAGARLFAARN